MPRSVVEGASGQLWAKWGENGFARYPLGAHLLDAAAAARELINWWLPPHLLELLQSSLGSQPVGDFLVFCAGLHDIGKANPIFQAQTLSRTPALFAEQKRHLISEGFEFPDPGRPSHDEARLLRRHEVTSALAVASRDGRPLADTFKSAPAVVVAGHHGRWHALDDNVAYDLGVACNTLVSGVTSGPWADAIDEIVELVSATIGVRGDELVECRPSAMVPIMTGLVCLADWLASSRVSVHAGTEAICQFGEDAELFYKRRRDWFKVYISDTLGTVTPPTTSFPHIFGFAPTRPVQRSLVKTSPQGLRLVMVPTGEGKTEAALGHWLSSAKPGQGLYFALPTMATADAMFPRVKNLFESASTPTLARIAHGRAILNSFYQESRHPYTAEIHDTDHTTGGLTAGSWFLGRHRALLAPVAVGTVDQLLSSVLRHKYNFLRLVGAATKTVVLDEVHSYDPYQSRLLERFLEWAGFLSIDTVVLSATLPTRRVNAYIAAYARGTSTTIEELGAVPYPSVITLTEGEVAIDDLSGQESGRERHVALTYASAAQPSIGAIDAVRAARAAAPSAKIGVIVNTVASAQAVGGELADHHPLVLHSRFPANERSARTNDAISRFGTSSTAGPDLLVATQIAEQSLDVDFDILITELCPAASLLQRIGRLWRHDDPDRRPRPPELRSATVTIIHPETLSVTQRAFLPYSSAEIHKTWVLGLHHGTRTSIDVPGDVQQMVNDADVTVDDLIDGANPLSELHFAAEMAAKLIADSRLIPSPARAEGRLGAELAGFSSGAIGNEETATRWSETDSVVLLPLSSTLDGCWTGLLPATADTESARDLLGHTIPLNGVAATRLLAAATPAPNSFVRKEWNTHPLLRDIVAVDLDSYPSLQLDPLLGLIVRKGSGS